MGIKDIWNRLFGREAEIDFSVPLQAKCEPFSEITSIDYNIPMVDRSLKREFTTHFGQPGLIKTRASRKISKRGKRSTAHDKAPSKSKRRSSSKKKFGPAKRKKLGR